MLGLERTVEDDISCVSRVVLEKLKSCNMLYLMQCSYASLIDDSKEIKTKKKDYLRSWFAALQTITFVMVLLRTSILSYQEVFGADRYYLILTGYDADTLDERNYYCFWEVFAIESNSWQYNLASLHRISISRRFQVPFFRK